MRRVGLLVLPILLMAFGASAQKPAKTVSGDGAKTSAPAHDFASAPAPHPSGAYGDLPLSFEANRGQADSQVKYMARGKGYTLFLTPKETVLALRHASPAAKQKPSANDAAVLPGLKHETVRWAEDVVRFKLAGASANPKMEGVEKLPGVSNYYIGNDPSRWQSGIPNYRKVVYRDAYPGIDVTYYGNPGLLESDFIVAPGADPSAIAWNVEGAAKLRVNEAGDLILETADASMRLQKPMVYQMVAGVRREVTGAYRVDRNTVRFAVGDYDRSQTLIIDPTLSYSTYLGGSNGQAGDVAYGVAVDTNGEAYVTGQASSTDFPTQSPFQGAIGDGSTENAFVTKFSADGASLIFSTYLGGSGTDQGAAIAFDGSGNAYVAGTAGSTNFPLLLPLSGQGEHTGGDCGFVSLFSATGTLSFSTYLCGGVNDDALRITLDANKNVYVAGNTQSPNFPTVNPLQASLAGTLNTYVAKLAPIQGGSSLLYSTFFGGNGFDFLQGLALDSGGNIYVSGSTNSSVFPTKNPIQATLKAQNGGFNSFVAEINAAGNALVYSTYLGGSVSDSNTGLAVDGSGNAYVVGDTRSPDFPVKNPLQALDPGGDAYVAKIAAGGATLDFSTFFGPANPEFDEFFGGGIALDSSVPPNIYITGATSSQVLPTRLPLQAISAGFGSAAFITEFKNDGSDYIFSTYLAGSSSPSFQGDRGFGLTLDLNNNIYVVGQTSTLDFPTVNPFQADLKDTPSTNGFVAKISPATPATPQLFPASLNFGPVLTATSSQPEVVTLANGTAALTITSIVMTGPNAADFSSFSTCGQTVPATVACNFTVTFTPSTTGTEETATVTINESGNSPQVFTLSGIGATTIPPPPPGTITINPTTLPSFGNEEVSITSASQFFTVTVTGTNPVTLQFTEATTGDFIQGSGGTNPCGFETPLPVGTVCQIAVAFDPIAAGPRSATFQLFGTFTGSPAGVAVSGTGVAKIASLTPTTLSFPNQVVGTTSSPMVVTLMNVSAAGGPSLTSIAPSVTAGFAISSTTCPVGAGLGPGQSCVFNIVFQPTSAGFAFGTFMVTDSDPALQSVSLSGTGLNATATLAPVSPTSLEFGRQTAGITSAAQSIFLQNTGNTTLTFTTPIGGASPNAFQATNSCSGAITVAAPQCFVNVTFTPTGAGPFFATLTIQSAAIGAPQTVLLSGTGIPTTTASLLPNPLVFPTTAMGVTSAVEYAFLNNTGPVADTVQNITIGGADPGDFQLTFSAPAQACNPGMLLNAQAVCVVGVTFTPTQAGTRTATLQVTDTATGTPQTITLQGTATGTGGATLTVMELGTGTGTVSSTPTGILCPSTCSAGFTSGQVVTLSATANSGSTFGSFSTNCTPASPQTNPPSCMVTLSGAATTVTVTFNTSGGGLTISPSTLPNGAIGGAYGQTLQVSGGTAPYNFTISAGTLPAGLNLGATSGTIGGVPTGPTGPSTFTVSVTDSSTPPLAGSANFTITIGAADGSNNSELNGTYAFLFQGFNDSDGTMVVVAGSFFADGHGNILPGGFEDANGSTGAQPTQELSASTYTIGADNRGSLFLTTPSGTTVLAISVGDIKAGVATKARFIRFDDVSGTNGHTGSGVILQQDPSIFALPAELMGSYAFGETGSNLTNGNPESGVGFVNADGNGNFTPAGVIDLDDGGILVSGAAISGTYALTSHTVSSGRLSASVTIAGVPGTASDVLYVVSSSQAVFISINTTLNTIYSGITQLQVPPAGGFGLGSLSGNAVVALQGKRADGTSTVGVGNATLDGNGNFTLAFDQNKAGTSTTGAAGGTYTVAGNGRAVLTVTTGTFNSPTAFLYLDGANQGFFAATDTAAAEGFFAPGGNNFNNASLSGNYFVGTIDPTALQASDLSGVASFDGVGTLQTTTDETNPVGNLEGDKQVSMPYNIALNGRLTFTATQPIVGYVASGCEAEIITTNGANPGLASFECQVTPASAETLTVTLAGTGSGTVTDGSGAINCPTTCTATFPSGTQITLTAFPDDGSTFTGWSGANSCEGTGTCTFTITAATAVTANFGGSSNNFALTVSPAGTGTGTVTSAPAGISCPTTCTANFASGTAVTLTAAAAEGSTFAGWTGSGCSGTGTCVVTVTAATAVTATFNTTNNFALTVTPAGTGAGTVMSAPAGIICPTTCTANFASGTAVTLTAVAGEGSTFAGWTGGGCSGTGTCVVTVTAATAVTATFNNGNTPVIISVGPGSSSTVNTVPGGSAVFGLVLTGQTGLTGTVQLTCTSPIASITCAIVPSSVTLNGTTTSVAIVVNTFCKGFIPNGGPNDVPNGGPTPGGFGTGLGLLLVALSLCGAAWTYKKQPRWAVSFGLLIIFGVGMSACSNLAKSPGGSATPPGSYPLVVTATPPSGAPSHVNLILVVKP